MQLPQYIIIISFTIRIEILVPFFQAIDIVFDNFAWHCQCLCLLKCQKNTRNACLQWKWKTEENFLYLVKIVQHKANDYNVTENWNARFTSFFFYLNILTNIVMNLEWTTCYKHFVCSEYFKIYEISLRRKENRNVLAKTHNIG